MRRDKRKTDMSGHRNFEELMAKMSPERRTCIKAEADDSHCEYVPSQICQQIDFTQADVAERLNVSHPTHTESERGNNMHICTLQKIAKDLDGELSFHVLIGGHDCNLKCLPDQKVV